MAYSWPGELTNKEQEILKQFRENVQDILQPDHDDVFLTRWLIAREFDLKKAETMIRNSFAWRKEIGADTILETWSPPEVVRKYYTGGLCGYDIDGCPVWIDPFGHIDLKGIVHSAKKQDIVKSKVYVLESILRAMEKRSKELGRRVGQISLIFDLDKVHLGHLYKPGMDVFCDILKMFEDNYPETLKANYVINAPRFFPVAYKIIRPFLSERTVGKVKVYGKPEMLWKWLLVQKMGLHVNSKYEAVIDLRVCGRHLVDSDFTDKCRLTKQLMAGDYLEHVLKAIDADQLPVYLGGTMLDSNNDPKCQTMVCFGGEVPKSYYLSANHFMDPKNMTSAVVPRASSHRAEVKVDTVGSVVRWSFRTEYNDIAYAVYYTPPGAGRLKVNEMEVVLQSSRVNSHLVPEDGMVTCSHAGTYILRFDNTYSWMKQKKVFYTIEVIPPAVMPHSQSEASFSSFPEEDEVYSSQPMCNGTEAPCGD